MTDREAIDKFEHAWRRYRRGEPPQVSVLRKPGGIYLVDTAGRIRAVVGEASCILTPWTTQAVGAMEE